MAVIEAGLDWAANRYPYVINELERLKTRLAQDDAFLPDIKAFLAADDVQKENTNDMFFLDAVDDLVVFMIKHLSRRMNLSDLRAELDEGTSTNKSLVRRILELGLLNSLALCLSYGAKLHLHDVPEVVMKDLGARMVERPTHWRSIRPEIQQLLNLSVFCSRVEDETKTFWGLQHFVVTSDAMHGIEDTQIVRVEELIRGEDKDGWKSLLWDNGYENTAWVHVPSTNVSNCITSLDPHG
jgi:hypothetical protein